MGLELLRLLGALVLVHLTLAAGPRALVLHEGRVELVRAQALHRLAVVDLIAALPRQAETARGLEKRR